MKTIETLKQEFVDRISEIDKSNMSIFELCNYAELLKKADELFKPSYMDCITSAIAPIGSLCAGKKEGT